MVVYHSQLSSRTLSLILRMFRFDYSGIFTEFLDVVLALGELGFISSTVRFF
jgi:hypothetical protein